ncbi:MAG: hypothetical protein WCH09_06630 [Bacteroidota bacterium]
MKQILSIFLTAILFASCHKKTDVINNKSACLNATRADFEKIQVFPTDHLLNKDISQSIMDPNSSSIIGAIGASSLHPDFGSGTWQGAAIGIPFSVVCGSQSKVPITYRSNSYDGNYGNESEQGPFPIPLNAAIEGNGIGDSHVISVDIENKLLYELYNATQVGLGWEASSGAVFDLKTNTYRTEGWTSADAAGLPILPCLLRYDEVNSGKIDHAIRFTLSKPKVYKGYVYPALHKVNGTGSSGTSLPMGARLRLKSNFDIRGYSVANQVILKAMKTYGIILADIGSDMFISGAPDYRWDDTDLQNLKKIKATDFEVVALGTIK